MEQEQTGRVTQNVSLDPADRHALVELAERYDGGNKSRTIQRLVRRAWAEERERGALTEPVPPIAERLAAAS